MIHLDTSYLIRALVPGSSEARSLRSWLRVPLGLEEAREGARLFNASGRRRGSFQDCLVAATALVAGAPLATANRTDFLRLEPFGLRFPELPEEP